MLIGSAKKEFQHVPAERLDEVDSLFEQLKAEQDLQLLMLADTDDAQCKWLSRLAQHYEHTVEMLQRSIDRHQQLKVGYESAIRQMCEGYKRVRETDSESSKARRLAF